MTPQEQAERAYHQAHAAMSNSLDEGYIDERGLQAMREGVANIGHVKDAFGADRYWVLRRLLAACEQLPRINEPALIQYEPAWHHHVPYPYQFKLDAAWIFVLALFVGGFAFKPLWLLAEFIAFMRALVWSSFRFPMTTMFFVGLFSGLLGGGRRRRW